MISFCAFTSPIQSNPSLEIIKKCVSSFPKFSKAYIFCDGYIINEKRRYRNKFGQVTREEAQRYEEFKKNLIQDPDFKNFKILTATKWLGFAQNLNYATKIIDTEYIFVVQHDWELKTKLNMRDVNDHLRVLNIDYLVLNSRQTRSSEDYLRYLVGSNDANKYKINSEKFNFIPFLHWHDKPHFAKISKYREIFHNFKIKRFPEDEYGQWIHKEFLNKKMSIFNEHRQFLLKESFIRHINGRQSPSHPIFSRSRDLSPSI